MGKKSQDIRKDIKNLPKGVVVLTEQATRRRLLNQAKAFGFEMEIREIIERTDRLMRECGNDQERKMIALYGNVEIHKLLGGSAPLEVDFKKVI